MSRKYKFLTENKMFKTRLILFLVIYIRNSLCMIEDLYNAGKKVDELYLKLNDIGLSDNYDLNDLDEIFGVTSEKNEDIWILINGIHEQLKVMDEYTNSRNLSDMFKLLPSEIVIYQCLDRLEIFVKSIDECYDIFHKYRKQTELDTHMTMLELTTSIGFEVQEGRTWIRDHVIEKNVFPRNHRNLIDAISNNTVKLQAQICDGPEFIATFLFRLLRTVMITEIKANIILPFVNIYLYPRDKLWMQINSIARDGFASRFGAYVKSFGESIDKVDSVYLRACDPPHGIWIPNAQFYELEQTFQTTIFRYHWGVCKYSSCNKIARTYRSNQCEVEPYNARTACFGYQDECAYLGTIKACVLDRGPYRFLYLNSSALGLLGMNMRCPKNDAQVIVDGIGPDIVRSACACNCYMNHNKISLLIMQSNVASNMVITGLRFIRKNRVLYIQPREGKLDAYGGIRRFSVKWISLPRNIDSSDIHSINKTNRIFFLEDLQLSAFHVLTGIKFNKVTRGNETGFAIEIFGVPFDYRNGTLRSERKFLISKRGSNKYLGEKLLFKSINPMYTKVSLKLSPASFNYISLERSELQDDFGQSTLPFFDAILASPNPPSMLGGVGIFHKGSEEYAGFISLRLFPIKYGKFFRDFQSMRMTDGKLSFNNSKHH